MIAEGTWFLIQAVAWAVLGPVVQGLLVLYVAALVGLVMLLLALGLLRRMLSP